MLLSILGLIVIAVAAYASVYKARIILEKLKPNQRKLRRDIWEMLAAQLFQSREGAEKVEALLALGAQHLQMESASLLALKEGAFVSLFAHGPTSAVEAGGTLSADQTFCSYTLKSQSGSTAIDYAGISDWRFTPIYKRTGVESYLGAAIQTKDQLPASLSFYSKSPRTRLFSSEEKKFVRILGEWISREV